MVKLKNPFLLLYVSVIIAASSISLAFAGSSSPKALNKMIELSVGGDAGQSFSGDCYLLQKTGKQRRHRVSGKVPTKLWLPAEAIRCYLEKSSGIGRMFLKLKRNGVQEIVQQSRPPLRWVYIASSGPWGQPTGGVSATRPTKKITR